MLLLIALEDYDAVLEYLNEVVGYWETISQKLHVKVNRIEELKNSRQSATICLREAVIDWLRLNYNHQRFGKPSWKKVAESVVKVNTKLFLRIASEHTKGESNNGT